MVFIGATEHLLEDGSRFFTGQLPVEVLAGLEFDRLWALHPEEYHEITILGKPTKTPRWQQAYGADYHYTGRVNRALPIPERLLTVRDWARASVDPRLNGLLLNWYDGQLGHYIGRHRDSTKNMVTDAPIVTISLGEERTFRLRRWKGGAVLNFAATNGTVFVMPYDTNQRWTHEVPRQAKHRGKRISVTLRAFEKAT